MKISEMIRVLEKKQVELGDVDVRGCAPMSSGFLVVDEVLDRDDYRDTNFFGNEFEKGKFIVIEWKDK